MKTKTIWMMPFLLTLFLPNIFAEHLPHLSIEGHTREVTSVAFSPDGKTLASSGGYNDSTVRLWDVNTGQHKYTFTRHKGGVNSVAFSPDGKTLASNRGDTVDLWDVNTGQHKYTLSYGRDVDFSPAGSIAFSPDGKTLASKKGMDIDLRDVNTGQHKRTLTGHKFRVNSVTFSPDGKTLASGSSDGTIRLWDVNTGQHKPIFLEQRDDVMSLAFSPDGRTLAGETIEPIPPRFSIRYIRLWDVKTRQQKHAFKSTFAVFSPDGRTLAIANWNDIDLWDVNTGTHTGTLSGHEGRVASFAFSPDGQILASRVYRRSSSDPVDPYPLRLWDVTTGKTKKTFAVSDQQRNQHKSRSFAFSPDGQTFAYTIGRSIYLWDPVSGQHKYSIFRHWVTDLAFSPDGQTLVSGGDRIILWDPVTRHQKLVLNTAGDRVAFSPDGRILASGNRIGPIHLWDPNTGKLQETFTLPTYTNNPWINSIVFSPDGRTLASSGASIILWNVNKGGHKVWRRSDDGAYNSVVFSPDGQILAATSKNGFISLWDANTLQPKYNLGEGLHINSIAFSPDGRTLVGEKRDRIDLWDVKTGLHKDTLYARGFSSILGIVVFSPDGRTIANRRGPNTIDLWDANSGQHITTLTETRVADDFHIPDSAGIAFSPDGRTIASGGKGNIIHLWKLPDTRVNITPYPVASPVIGEQFTINLSIVEGENVGGYQLTVGFDETILRYVESANGDYLPPRSFFVPPVVSEKSVTLGATSLTGTNNGDGTLATVTFEVLEVKESPIALSDVILTDSAGKQLSILSNSGRIQPTLSSTSVVVDLTPSSVLAPAIGEQLVFNIRISDGQNVAGYQISLEYDIKALKPVLASNGVYLPDASPAKPLISQGLVTLGASSSTGVGNGDGVIATITFEVLVVQASTVSVSGYLTTPNGRRSTPTFKDAKVIVALLGDVNRDGTVNILDLVLVSSSFGQQVPETGNPADVNEDGVVNVVDLVTVAGAIGGDAAAPSLHPQALAAFTVSDVQQWLTQAQHVELNDARSQRGIRFLEQLLIALIPKETALLANYPNPFNPETWIPYQLAQPADVTLTIYAIDGTVVRTLTLGHQPVGIYQDKSRAAYWDGRNEVGELVASGVYFYTLTADDFTATRKMLIRK